MAIEPISYPYGVNPPGGGSSGGGTVESVTAGAGLTGGVITTTGTIAIDETVVATLTGIQTLSNKTFTTPTIASFANANHNHQDGAGGGQLNAGSIFNAGVVAITYGGTGANSASGARINLELEIGTDVQAWSSNLDAFSLKTAPSGVILGTTDSQIVTNKDINGDNNTLSNIGLGSLKVISGDAYKLITRDASGNVISSSSLFNRSDRLGIGTDNPGHDIHISSATPTFLMQDRKSVV